jgi:hypothetical protein
MWSPTIPRLCMSLFVWTIHLVIDGSISRFHLETFTPSYPFQHVLWWDIWSSLCLNSIMFWPKGECLAYSLTNLPRLLISFLGLFHNLSNMTWTAPSFNCKYPSMCVHTSHWPYGYPFFMLRSWQGMYWNPWCNSRHLCHHCTKC